METALRGKGQRPGKQVWEEAWKQVWREVEERVRLEAGMESDGRRCGRESETRMRGIVRWGGLKSRREVLNEIQRALLNGTGSLHSAGVRRFLK